MSSNARMIVGIDLGTTNSVVAYVDADANSDPTAARAAGGPRARPPIRIFEVPQVVEPGHVAARPLLPSYLYLAGEHDLPAGSLDLPWARGRDYAVGELAQKRGAEVPGRVVASAKSWLRHRSVDRTAAILPWDAPSDVPRVSPLTAETRILEHVRDAWNQVIAAGDPELRLEAQDVYLVRPGLLRSGGARAHGARGRGGGARASDAPRGAAGRLLRLARPPRGALAGSSPGRRPGARLRRRRGHHRLHADRGRRSRRRSRRSSGWRWAITCSSAATTWT